jgi:hypothetical protein
LLGVVDGVFVVVALVSRDNVGCTTLSFIASALKGQTPKRKRVNENTRSRIFRRQVPISYQRVKTKKRFESSKTLVYQQTIASSDEECEHS